MKSSDPCDESLVLAGCCMGCCLVVLRSECGRLLGLLFGGGLDLHVGED